ncbi:hypothetical protein JCM18750_18150 [Halostagnicola bangensis]
MSDREKYGFRAECEHGLQGSAHSSVGFPDIQVWTAPNRTLRPIPKSPVPILKIPVPILEILAPVRQGPKNPRRGRG